MEVLDLLRNTGISPHLASSRAGGEYASACPACGNLSKPDSDRFRVWPAENNGSGSYWCRACGKYGDNVQFCRDFLNMDFRQAATHCGRLDLLENQPAGHNYRPPRPLALPATAQPPVAGPDHQPRQCESPGQEWRHAAAELARQAHETLLATPAALDYLAGRGLDRATVRRHSLGLIGQDQYSSRAKWGLPPVANAAGKAKPLWLPAGLVIPCLQAGEVIRLRIRRSAAGRKKFQPELKYYVVPGSSGATMVIHPERRAQVIVEAELDGMAVAAAQPHAGAVALGSVAAKPDAAATAVLQQSLCILEALDNDGAGPGQKAVAKASAWWRATFPATCERWPVLQGKDPGEAVAAGLDLGLWITAGLPPVFHVTGQDEGPRAKSDQVNKTEPVPAANISTPAAGPDSLQALAKVLTGHPLVVVKTDTELSIVQTGQAPLAALRQLAELLFYDDLVLDTICRLPNGRIHGRNITPLLEGLAA